MNWNLVFCVKVNNPQPILGYLVTEAEFSDNCADDILLVHPGHPGVDVAKSNFDIVPVGSVNKYIPEAPWSHSSSLPLGRGWK